MIIDRILDRKDGFGFSEADLRYMYDEATLFWMEGLARAIDGGENSDIQRELCKYIDDNGYNKSIKRYVNKVNWTEYDKRSAA